MSLSRISIVDYRGYTLYDTFIRPPYDVADYRTEVTGLSAHHLANAPDCLQVRNVIAPLLKDKIIVGYALGQFLYTMGLTHPAIDTRDLALFLPFRRSLRYKSTTMVPLDTLINRLMGRHIGLHGEIPLEQARASMDLFRSSEQVWEGVIKSGSWPCSFPPETHGHCFT